MYGSIYPYRPYDASPELLRAMAVVRPFLRERPQLHGRVLYAQVAKARGLQQYDPQAVVLQALRQEPPASGLCGLLASPLGQVALDALALEFPGWGIVFDLLPPAAKLICTERRQATAQTIFGSATFAAGIGLVIYALKRAA